MFSYQAKWIFPALLLIAANVMSGCQSLSDQASTQKNPTPQERVADLQIVDCLLPGQMRMLGSRSYMTPRRPTRTNASDCRIRGGEYVAYDRADYKTALSVWMTEAESGDAEAQANVGEIFERGLGGSPNYTAALFWYKKSAEQGNKKSQFNIGTLYEQGLGVEKSMTVALNWYRKAWGVPANELMFKSVYDGEL
jgi:TPR repeat protein